MSAKHTPGAGRDSAGRDYERPLDEKRVVYVGDVTVTIEGDELADVAAVQRVVEAADCSAHRKREEGGAVAKYKIVGPFTSHDQPDYSFVCNVSDAESGFLIARLYGVGGSEAKDAAEEFCRAREAFGPCVQALRLALELHNDVLARAMLPDARGTLTRYGGEAELFDPKAEKQIREAIKLADEKP